MYKRVSSFVEEKENVANMMSCPLPMTLPILSSALHSDFSPVHIGVKPSSFMYLRTCYMTVKYKCCPQRATPMILWPLSQQKVHRNEMDTQTNNGTAHLDPIYMSFNR
ncbi:uncharacterized protein LOC118738074 isoform X1 [Rhagoletis pomonella]|uniref:uncharacterized protein LOC118738074 isoform X1 n=1 Tax=Rhagoletis pomonella TaxID=28610 RepID=UPI00177D78F6|nr:uncharacterized protein LOC118738074 isoform X1 [Rhagoletis pomonella]